MKHLCECSNAEVFHFRNKAIDVESPGRLAMHDQGEVVSNDSASDLLKPARQLQGLAPADSLDQTVHPSHTADVEGSAVAKAEKYERHIGQDVVEDSPSKRLKLDHHPESQTPTCSERVKGVAPIKAEYLVHAPGSKGDRGAAIADDDAAEGAAHQDGSKDDSRGKKKQRSKGQNHNRDYGIARDEVGLCSSRTNSPEFAPDQCQFGETCRFEHDLRKYLDKWKREDLKTLGGRCPVWESKGKCDAGWKCRFVGSHMLERDTEDGRKELILDEREQGDPNGSVSSIHRSGVINDVSAQSKIELAKRKFQTPKSDQFNEWIEKNGKELEQRQRQDARRRNGPEDKESEETLKDVRAAFTEPPFMPSEKRKVYFGPETPVLAPLTTQGNTPFRRLCVGLGAQATYSEMAMSMPLIQGQKSEWALLRGHSSEALPPAYTPKGNVVKGYDNSKDFKFGAQIASNKPWQALKVTEVITALCPHLRVVDLNCGCPIDLVYRQGAGSALLDSPGKLEKILRGMNAVSGEVPITVKIRMGTKDKRPNALKLVDRFVYGGQDAYDADQGPCGIAAITLHGRSRQQRYTRNADWEYIADCAALINDYNERGDSLSDTIREADASSQSSNGKVYFLGNGDCYSHTDYYEHLEEAKVDSVMIARGALIKPWIFEEIEKGQYIDKSATERLSLVEQFVRYGLDAWGSDERGVGTTRRFLLEWLSFAYRYVPVGIMEHLPPSLQDRPPAWRGRNELETLLGSDNYIDWIKIR